MYNFTAKFNLSLLSHLVCSERKKIARDERGNPARRLEEKSVGISLHILKQWCSSPPNRYHASIYACVRVFVCVELGHLTFAVSQTAVVAHRAEVLKYKHSYC